MGAGLGAAGGAFSGLGEVGGAVARGVAGSMITQGIGVATGLQSKFDWANVAAAGVGAGVGAAVGGQLSLDHADWDPHVVGFASGMAGAIAGAATRTLITGTDFGDNLLATLPSAIGNTIGNIAADRLSDAIWAPGGDGGVGDSGADNADKTAGNYPPVPLTVAAQPTLPQPGSLSFNPSELLIVKPPSIPNPNGNGFLTTQAQLEARLAARQIGFDTDHASSDINSTQLALTGEVRPDPEGVPGFSRESKEFGGDFVDAMKHLLGFKGPAEDMAAYARQGTVQGDYEREKSISWNYSTQQDSMGNVGTSGAPTVTFNVSSDSDGVQFIDRNGDNRYDLEVAHVPGPNGTEIVKVNYGDGKGFVPYDPDNVLPPPPNPRTYEPPSGAE